MRSRLKNFVFLAICESWLYCLLGFLTPALAQELSNVPDKYKKINQTSLRGALRFERTCFDVKYYELSLKINVGKEYINGSNLIFFQTTDTTNIIQIDLDRSYKIDSILFEKKQVSFFKHHHAFFIYFPYTLTKNSLYAVQIFYSGDAVNKTVNSRNGKGILFNKDNSNRNWVGVSCEHVGASLWFPNKDHLIDEPDSVRLRWIYPNDLACISNGKLEAIQKDVERGYNSTTWFVRNPINNYNITFYLGNYQKIIFPYTSVNGKKYELGCYFLDYEKGVAYSYYKLTPAILRFFEELFGEYPYWDDKFAVIQSPYIGMEHQGCLAIGSELLNINNHYYTTTTNYHSTLIHEMAHEWWGNSVSAKDMAHAWLHEGFATYCEMLYIERMQGKEKYLQNITHLREMIFLFERRAIVGKENINDNMFESGHIYFKGAVFLHDLRDKIGNDVIFFDILKTFQIKYKNKTVDTTDFLNLVNEKTGRVFTRFFEQRLYNK